MLNVMRDSFKPGSRLRPLLQVFLLLVAVSFTFYLGAYFFGQRSDNGREGDWAAKVNGREISSREFTSRARNIDGYYRKLFGTNYEQLRKSLRVGSQAIRQLVDDELILQDAERLQLRVSREELAERIRTDPSLKDASGLFIGTERYQDVVGKNYPGGVPAFEQAMGTQILIDHWNDLMTQSADVGDAELEREYRRRNEKAAIDYVLVASQRSPVATTVSDAEARSWYDAHREHYQRPESRRIRFVRVDRSSQLAQVQVSDAEAQASYDANRSNYTHPEQRRARHILFRLPAEAKPADKQRLRQQAEAALARLHAGEAFEPLARSLSQDPASAQQDGDLGFFSRGQMLPAFDEAAFNTPIGQLAPVVETSVGFHVIQVTDSRPQGQTPFPDVREAIVQQLKLRRAQERAEAEAKRIHDSIPAPQQLEEAAKREGLRVESRLLLRGERLGELGASNDVTDAIFALAPGSLGQPLRTATGMLLVAVDESVPPGVAPFEEAADGVRTDVLNERARAAALASAQQALTRYGSLDAVAHGLELERQHSGDLAPGQGLPSAGGQAPELDARLFAPSAHVGERGVAAVPAGAVIYEITQRQAFDAAAFSAARDALRRELREERRNNLRESILAQLRRREEVQVNDALVARHDG
ncbi:MAG TPA: peptidyl-prolyl cis-trans isomerase [Candidatus Polarisedimenticolaceae bacterium]|nr:peptidyl-prolyl cis-trans isomerase [Candidatus Polarisedimenticolaceae bacterium]